MEAAAARAAAEPATVTKAAGMAELSDAVKTQITETTGGGDEAKLEFVASGGQVPPRIGRQTRDDMLRQGADFRFATR